MLQFVVIFSKINFSSVFLHYYYHYRYWYCSVFPNQPHFQSHVNPWQRHKYTLFTTPARKTKPFISRKDKRGYWCCFLLTTNLDDFSLANCRRFTKFTKLFTRQTFLLYGNFILLFAYKFVEMKHCFIEGVWYPWQPRIPLFVSQWVKV